ncbi:ecotin family protein [Aeoliella sp. SH292]|uniref:ecotin family protein n=1 Tax=Aeoliella sp. SH292 TaxID=3454464 RepID=UPI003F974370
MMNRSLTLLAVLLFLLGSATTRADEQKKNLDAFPPAGDGMVRYVIALPHKERGEEDDFRVEIIVGKEMMTDGVNTVRLGGELTINDLEGWGFTYYEVAEFGPAASTLIGVPAETPQVKKFVQGPTLTIPYNSRIPVVVYVPEDGEVRFRIWKAKKMKKAKQG